MSLEKHYTMKEASRIIGVSVRRLQIWDKLPMCRPLPLAAKALDEPLVIEVKGRDENL